MKRCRGPGMFGRSFADIAVVDVFVRRVFRVVEHRDAPASILLRHDGYRDELRERSSIAGASAATVPEL
jgi:hypothetical protein